MDLLEAMLKFYATSTETFLVCVFNITSKRARFTIDIVRWSRSEESLSEDDQWEEDTA